MLGTGAQNTITEPWDPHIWRTEFLEYCELVREGWIFISQDFVCIFNCHAQKTLCLVLFESSSHCFPWYSSANVFSEEEILDSIHPLWGYPVFSKFGSPSEHANIPVHFTFRNSQCFSHFFLDFLVFSFDPEGMI